MRKVCVAGHFGKGKRLREQPVDIQVLVATMNQTDASFLEKMNISSDIVVGNQNGLIEYKKIKQGGRMIGFYCSDKRGLSNNRNLTLRHSTADICLLSDDDLCYEDHYEEIVKNAFSRFPEADIIIFNLYENPVERYVIQRPFRVGTFNYMRFGSVRIAFKRKSVVEKGICFDSRFGAGSDIPLGEDTIFLRDCLAAGLKIMAVPEYILSLTNERDSTWFHGYDEQYFRNKGKMYYRISSSHYRFLCLQDAIRHREAYTNYGDCLKTYNTMICGAKIFKNYFGRGAS